MFTTYGRLEMQKNDFEKAYAEIDEGVKLITPTRQRDCLFVKQRMQIAKNDMSKAPSKPLKTCSGSRSSLPKSFEYFDATILFAEGKWYQAERRAQQTAARAWPDSTAASPSRSVSTSP